MAAAAVTDGDQDMAAADAAAPLTFTDVQREAAAKQRAYDASTAGPSGRGADTAGTFLPALAHSELRPGAAHAQAALQGLLSLALGRPAQPLRCAVAVAVVDNSDPVFVPRSLAGVNERVNHAVFQGLWYTVCRATGSRMHVHFAHCITQAVCEGLLTGGRACADGSRRAFYRDFVKVVEAADVVVEVLDARDPLSCRCVDVERFIRRAGASKKIILLLNKIGASASAPGVHRLQSPEAPLCLFHCRVSIGKGKRDGWGFKAQAGSLSLWW